MNISFAKLLFAVLLSAFSSICIWLSLNLRYISEWWDQNVLFNIMFFSPIIGILTYYYWGKAVDIFESLWAARFVAFSINTIVFGLLTWYIIGESPLDIKTVTCLFLSIMILLIQVLL